jgi:hypothetical protein
MPPAAVVPIRYPDKVKFTSNDLQDVRVPRRLAFSGDFGQKMPDLAEICRFPRLFPAFRFRTSVFPPQQHFGRNRV